MTGTPQAAPPMLPFEKAEKLFEVPPAEIPGEAPVELPQAPIAIEFRITPHRLARYDRTEGCVRCETDNQVWGILRPARPESMSFL